MSDTTGFTGKEEVFKNKKDDAAFLATLKKWHGASAKSRQRLDWEWYLYDNFYRGNHYIEFNRRTGEIIVPPKPPQRVRLSVNKVYAISRAIRNFATSQQPKWEVIVDTEDPAEQENSRKQADILDFYYDYLNIPRIIKGATLHAIKFGIGIIQYGWDDEAYGLNDQKGEMYCWVRDPFDVYFDQSGVNSGNIQDCRFIDVVVPKSFQEIMDNPIYKKVQEFEISGEDKRAASAYKDMILKKKYSADSMSDELKTVLLHETWYKKKSKDGFKICIASWIDGHLLRDDETDLDEYPFIDFSSDDNPNELYGEGYLKNLIPIAKVVNRLESQIVEYNNLANVNRYVRGKGAGISSISNINGEIVDVSDVNQFRELQPRGLAPDIHNQIGRLLGYMDEISGVSDAFRGTTPQGVTAGVAIEALQEKSANNLQDLKDNVENALQRLGKGILTMIAKNVVVPRSVRIDNGSKLVDQQNSVYKFVGENATDEMKRGATVVGSENRIKVTIGTALAYTRQGRYNLLKDLYVNKVIGADAVLAGMDFPDLRNVIDNAKRAQIDQAMIANIQSNGIPGSNPMQPPMPQGMPQSPDDWVKLAQDEDSAILQGNPIPPTEGATREHTAQHIADSQTPEFQQNGKALEILLAHVKGEEQQQGLDVPDITNNEGQTNG